MAKSYQKGPWNTLKCTREHLKSKIFRGPSAGPAPHAVASQLFIDQKFLNTPLEKILRTPLHVRMVLIRWTAVENMYFAKFKMAQWHIL